VAGAGVNVSGNQQAAHLNVDIAGFKFRNPEDNSDGSRSLAFYFGYIDVEGAWDNSTQTSTITGAALELLASFMDIVVYYDNDGVPGLQINASRGDNFLCSQPANSEIDCIDITSGTAIDITKLSWTGIVVTKIACPSSGNYQANCTVYSARTATVGGEIAFTLKLASEPVLYNGVRIDSSYGKIDVEINYPWDTVSPAIPSKAKVGLIAATAGKAADGTGTWSKVGGDTAVAYNAENKAAYFSWDKTSSVQSQDGATVYYQGISGETLLALDCSKTNCGLAGVIYGPLQVAAGVWKALGWTTDIILFSWDEVKPTNILWDPELGFVNNKLTTQTDDQDNLALAMKPVSAIVCLVLLVIARLF